MAGLELGTQGLVYECERSTNQPHMLSGTVDCKER